MKHLWDRYRRWRRDRAVEHFENEGARHAAEEGRYEARTQARRPQGSGRPTGYDEGHTRERF